MEQKKTREILITESYLYSNPYNFLSFLIKSLCRIKKKEIIEKISININTVLKKGLMVVTLDELDIIHHHFLLFIAIKESAISNDFTIHTLRKLCFIYTEFIKFTRNEAATKEMKWPALFSDK
jgi:hypothetical protein